MSPDKNPVPDFSDVTGGSSSTAPKVPQPTAALRTHTVVQGDSLSKIAKSFYSDAGKWRLIYEANKSVVGSNPDLIKPGQVLTIPDA